MALGAATLADIFEPAERGAMMGIYYIAPLLGPSLGSIIGGALAQAWDWRATFWFLAVWSGLSVISFIFFKDTFRKERSLTYQACLRRLKEDRAAAADKLSNKAVIEQTESEEKDQDVEAQNVLPAPIKEIKLSLKDLNPVTPIRHVLRRPNNLAIYFPSGACCFIVTMV